MPTNFVPVEAAYGGVPAETLSDGWTSVRTSVSPAGVGMPWEGDEEPAPVKRVVTKKQVEDDGTNCLYKAGCKGVRVPGSTACFGHDRLLRANGDES